MAAAEDTPRRRSKSRSKSRNTIRNVKRILVLSCHNKNNKSSKHIGLNIEDFVRSLHGDNPFTIEYYTKSDIENDMMFYNDNINKFSLIIMNRCNLVDIHVSSVKYMLKYNGLLAVKYYNIYKGPLYNTQFNKKSINNTITTINSINKLKNRFDKEFVFYEENNGYSLYKRFSDIFQ